MQKYSSRTLHAQVTRIPGTEWSGLRVMDPMEGRQVWWEDLTEDEGKLLWLAEELEHTQVAWIHLGDLIEDLLD